MATAYAQCVTVEEEGWRYFAPWLRLVADDGRFERVRRGDYDGQRYGDAWATVYGETQGFELKVEAEEKHGTFFLESWSNRDSGRRGWLYTSKADWLCYMFLAPSVCLYVFDFVAVQAWAFAHDVARFPELKQRKRTQDNPSWGYSVPIDTLMAEVERTPKLWRWDGGRWR